MKRTVGLTIIIILTLGMILFAYRHLFGELTLVVRLTLWALALVILAGCLARMATQLGNFYFWYAGELEALAQKREVTRRARVKTENLAFRGRMQITTAPAGHQVYITRPESAIFTDPLHLIQGRANGVAQNWEPGNWNFFNGLFAPRTLEALPAQASPPAALPQPLPDWVDLAPYVAHGASLQHIMLGLGRFPSGEVRPVIAPLHRLVHIGLAGASGFGKSTMALSLAWQVLNAREKPRPVLLDGQGVTFTYFRGDPRLLYPLADGESEIEGILEAMVMEMERRQELFREFLGVDSLEKYNALVTDPLPALPVFFDEFSVVRDNRAIAGFCLKLAQKGRKVGIPLIAGCQTWLAQDIGSALRANVATGIQFYVRDKSQARLLLGSPEAASLSRPGQAYAALPGQTGLIELQTPDPSSLLSHLLGQRVEGELGEAPQPSRVSGPIPWDKELVLRTWQETGSLAAVARAHGKSPGGKQNEEIRAILKEEGLEG